MEIVKKQFIEISEYELETLKDLMLEIEIGIKKSGFSNHIMVDLYSKKNKNETQELVRFFNEVIIERGNITSNSNLTNEFA